MYYGLQLVVIFYLHSKQSKEYQSCTCHFKAKVPSGLPLLTKHTNSFDKLNQGETKTYLLTKKL